MVPDEPDSQVTQLLASCRAGDRAAGAQLMPLVYEELRGLARGVFAGQPGVKTLQPTVLVHEAWMKLCGSLGSIEDRRHFFVLAGKAMRQVLTDHVRGRLRQKRGDGAQQITFDTDLASGPGGLDLVELDDCLTELAAFNERRYGTRFIAAHLAGRLS